MPTKYISQHSSGFHGGQFTSEEAKGVAKNIKVTSPKSLQKFQKTHSKKLQYNEPKLAQNIEALFFSRIMVEKLCKQLQVNQQKDFLY